MTSVGREIELGELWRRERLEEKRLVEAVEVELKGWVCWSVSPEAEEPDVDAAEGGRPLTSSSSDRICVCVCDNT